MIIASKGHVRMKGTGADILTEFITIAVSLMEHDEYITRDTLKLAVDIACLEKEDLDNEHRSN